MSVPVVKVIWLAILAIIGVFVVKKISGSDENIFKLKNLILILFLILLPAVIYDLNYSYIFSLITFVITIITYKYILNISYIKSSLSCGILHLFLIILDFLAMCLLSIFISSDIMRTSEYITIIFNLLYSVILMLLFYKTKLGITISKFVDKIVDKKQTKIVFFFILIVVGMSIVLCLLSQNLDIESIFTTNFALFIILFLLVIILFTERNSYDKLSLEYDNLFNYVKVFEDWIEKEKFIRHEYKNQLAVLRSMTKQKNIRDKIDSIVDDMINIDDNVINDLSNLPNGGLKGLLYYKIAVAKGKKISVEIDIGNQINVLFKQLNDDKAKVLSKIIGVYFDNAIEAAEQTKKKIISLEIYNLDSKLHIVISNSFSGTIDIERIHDKGVSTKGNGRGNGLYFVSKLLNKNTWLKTEQKIINNFYIAKIIIL